jgi:hypothetical protein
MLQRAVEKEVFAAIKIKTLIPEDIIGLKLQAIKNNPKRQHGEIEDIIFLTENYKNEINWSLIEHKEIFPHGGN